MKPSPTILLTASSGWTDAVRQRRRAMPQRLAVGLVSAMVFAPLIGIWASLAWGVGYSVVVAFEHLTFMPLAAREPKALNGARTAVGMVAVALNSLYFGALSVPLWLVSDFMGGVCSVLLLTAGTVYGMINSRGSRLVLALTAGVQIAYLLATPVFMIMTGAPAAYAAVSAMTVLVFAAYCVSAWNRIEEVRRAEARARVEADERRIQAERVLSERNAFMAAIGHDLRTPLSAILAGARADGANRSQARLITDAAGMMVGLLDDLLDHAKLEAGRMAIESTDFDLRDLILQTARLWRGPLRAKGLKLRVIGAHVLPAVVRGDALRLRQVLNNLISNAVKFTADGGVTLSFRSWEDDPSGHQLLIEVTDTGAGMTRDQLARLFTPFDQTQEGVSARHGGTGLGLAISRHLVTLMGGHLTARSEPGAGSTFTLSLALADGQGVRRALPIPSLQRRFISTNIGAAEAVTGRAAASGREPEIAQTQAMSAADLLTSLGGVIDAGEIHSPAQKVAPAPNEVVVETESPATGQRLSVLVVDDHEINRRALQLMLEPMGCEAVLAVNGLDALDRCTSETFDLIFMDVRMPELDGRETTRRLRASGGTNAATPVIAVTADTQPEDVRACLDAGMSHFVGKPVEPAALIEAIAVATLGQTGQARVA